MMGTTPRSSSCVITCCGMCYNFTARHHHAVCGVRISKALPITCRFERRSALLKSKAVTSICDVEMSYLAQSVTVCRWMNAKQERSGAFAINSNTAALTG